MSNSSALLDDSMITFHYLTSKNSIYYIPEPMVVYRQLSRSSWNKRSDFEKYYVALIFYEMANKVNPRFKYFNYLRHFQVFLFVYKRRNSEEWMLVNNKYRKKGNTAFLNCGDFLYQTIHYKKLNKLNKIRYHLKYGWLPFVGLFYRMQLSVIKRIYS